MTPKDKPFYQQLGQRIAHLRKAQSLPQLQLADRLGIAQQTLAHHETGRLRIATASLPPLAEALEISVEELIERDLPDLPVERSLLSALQRARSVQEVFLVNGREAGALTAALRGENPGTRIYRAA